MNLLWRGRALTCVDAYARYTRHMHVILRLLATPRAPFIESSSSGCADAVYAKMCPIVCLAIRVKTDSHRPDPTRLDLIVSRVAIN